MKRAMRVAFVGALHSTGLLQLLLRLELRKRAVVLMYHRVLPAEARAETWSHPATVVTRETFERHIRLLRRHFRVLSAAEFQECLERGRFEPRSCLVTFDDGWIDTYTEAWPILKRYGVPALVFLPSAYIGTGLVFWQERLGRVLYSIWGRARSEPEFAVGARVALAMFGLEVVLDFDQSNVRPQIVNLVRSRKSDASTDPAAPVRALGALVPDVESGTVHVDRFIDWDQAREMARDGVTFGAHGDTHRRLTTLSASEVMREVLASRDALSRSLSIEPAAFCYPNGDWNSEVAAAVEHGQFRFAFSTDRGRVFPGANRLALRRVNIHEDMTGWTPMFLARLIGVV